MHTHVYTLMHTLTHFYKSKCQYPAVKDECRRLTPVWQVRSILTVPEPIGSLSRPPHHTCPITPILATSPFSFPETEQCEMEPTEAQTLPVFHLRRHPKESCWAHGRKGEWLFQFHVLAIPLYVYSVASQPRSLPLCSNVIALLNTS